MKNYYNEINKAISEYENHHPYPTKSTSWIANRIDWCWRFRKISESELEELANRMTNIFKNNLTNI